MAEHRGNATEEPSPRRLREARERGQIARSGDLSSAAAFAAGAGALAIGASAMVAGAAELLRRGLERAVAPEPAAFGAVLREGMGDTVRLVAPIAGAAFV